MSSPNVSFLHANLLQPTALYCGFQRPLAFGGAWAKLWSGLTGAFGLQHHIAAQSRGFGLRTPFTV